MKLILKKNVKKLGQAGDIVTAADGYANSYLIPQGLAVMATDSEVRKLDAKKNAVSSKELQEKQQLRNIFNQVDGNTYTTTQRANKDGHLFATVNEKVIVELAGAGLKESHLNLPEGIKQAGDYTVEIQVGENKGSLHLSVKAE